MIDKIPDLFCHLFAAGYDLSTPHGYEKVMKECDDVVGLDQVECFHLNDCKKPLQGSRVCVLGAAYKKKGKVISYGTVPKKGECPKGGFFGKLEITFGGSNQYGEFGIAPKTVTKVIRVPCPRR